MINFYLIAEVARLEHEERVRLMAPVPDFFEPMKADRPGWVSRQVVRSLHAVASGLASLRRFVKEQRVISIQRDLRRAKE